jgi:Fur family ferric uptake transcriptional regulator
MQSRGNVNVSYSTRQRTLILDILRGADKPLTPPEIRERASHGGAEIGLATVYRALKFFMEQGMIVPVEISGTAPCYEPAERGHHHHCVCQQCQRVFDLQGCVRGVERLAPLEFRIQRHEIILYGVCAACTQR